MEVDTVLLKVASRCNLDCTYCYVYHLGDDAWKNQPKRMSRLVIGRTCEQLGELARAQGRPFSVVLHGGEPLLLGGAALADLFSRLRAALPPDCGLHVQTNGVLLNDQIVDLCLEHRVGISISLDGPARLHDRFRIDHAGHGSHAGVLRGIALLRDRPKARWLFSGILCVVDPASDPAEVYSFLKSTEAPSLDFLYRDGNHSQLPFGKASFESVEYGNWMCRLLDIYLSDRSPPRVRILDDFLRLILGGRGVKEGAGTESYGILIVETDGTINKNDTLKSAGSASDQFEASWSVMDGNLVNLMASEEFASYYALQRPSAPQCLECPDLGVCGGGMPAHRWRDANGFDNPSVFCSDQRLLIARMRSILTANRGAA
ncbi:cyclophane-forming radical SAM/SPASM peptide maturase YhhB [Bradyrhizobium ganzhouense]|uniref:cyclophane-forming radical SAM/SPASM peptide maturase YhhB n=1 Tax=Bradyrhizobium ganzhouense TaxID=1179767 RepID=UPI003CEA9ADE